MRAVFQQLLFVSVLLTALVACPNTPPVVDPPIDETPIKSAFGTPAGSAVTQTIVAAGGSFSEATTGVTVKAFAGAVDASAQVKVQPITNTLPDGIGMGVEISSSQPLKKPLIVRFSYDASEPDPNSLRLALQADDGAWWSLAPFKVDTVNKTVSAALPDNLPTPASGSSRMRPQGTLSIKRVVKYLAFYMKPKSATVKVGKSGEFVPYTRVLEKEPCQSETVLGGDDELATLCKAKKVVKEYPFSNNKAGFVRNWSVNGVVGGDSTNGFIKPNASVGATYTAPAKAPTPNTVTVSFESTDTQTRQKLVMLATVTIVSEYKVVGDLTAIGHFACSGVAVADFEDRIEFTLTNNGGTVGSPYLIGSIQNRPSVIKNFRLYTPAPPWVVLTQDSAAEVFDATTGVAVVNGTSGTVEVIIEGKFLLGDCTITALPPLAPGPTILPIPSPGPLYFTVPFQFNLNSFNNNTQTVTVANPSLFGGGIWKFTITRQ